MEHNSAILIADLSGYTALTEAHGASAAAETIEKYLKIVKLSLIGNSKLHQCVGDEVMIVSKSADDLIKTAIMLFQNCSGENLFLQIHGGLHFGKILKQNNNYFGSPVNLTSRIAGKASNGTFWCSLAFIKALKKSSVQERDGTPPNQSRFDAQYRVHGCPVKRVGDVLRRV